MKKLIEELQTEIERRDLKEAALEGLFLALQIVKAHDPWIDVNKELPPLFALGMSRDVLTIAGDKMNVKCYDWELKRWSGSPHVTVTHWAYLPEVKE